MGWKIKGKFNNDCPNFSYLILIMNALNIKKYGIDGYIFYDMSR